MQTNEQKNDKLTRFTDMLVNKRLRIFLIMIALTIASIVAMFFVYEHFDMERYLPSNSNMRAGLAIMEVEWAPDADADATPSAPSTRTILVMFEGLSDAQVDLAEDTFIGWEEDSESAITGIGDFDKNSRHFRINDERGNYTLFIVSTRLTAGSDTLALRDYIVQYFTSAPHNFIVHTHTPGVSGNNLLDFMILIAAGLMVAVLLVMCKSFFDPIIIFAGLGVAVLMNMGTNIFFIGGIAAMTTPIAGVLQFILSIVCTLIVLNRYKAEKKRLALPDNAQAMKNALRNSFKTIVSACSATFIGLLMLPFMSFTIGIEMGIIFAKGVLFTVLSIYTILPSVTLKFDKCITACDKDVLMARFKKWRASKKGLVVAANTTVPQAIQAEKIVEDVAVAQNIQENNATIIADDIPITSSKTYVVDGTNIRADATDCCPKCDPTQPLSTPTDLDDCDLLKAKGIKPAFGRFAFKFRYALIAFFVVLFVGVSIGQSFLTTQFAMPVENHIDLTFPRDMLVIIYNNEDERHIPAFLNWLDDVDEYGNPLRNIREINSVATDLSEIITPFPASVIAMITEEDISLVQQVFDAANDYAGTDTMSLYDFLATLASPAWITLVENNHDGTPEGIAAAESDAELIRSGFAEMSTGRRMLQGENYSRMILELGYLAEGDITQAFYEALTEYLEVLFDHSFYLIGNGAMAFELNATFYLEYLLISLALALALYAVLAIAFKKVLLPIMLISVVQVAMFVMMTILAMTGSGIFFLAIFIVQAVVKGSTLEWGVLLANSYEEARRTMPKRQSLIWAILNSGRVILTSATIMTVVTGVLGLVMSGQEASIMLGMALATLASAVLTLLVLPALLVVFDRFVISKKKNGTDEKDEPKPIRATATASV